MIRAVLFDRDGTLVADARGRRDAIEIMPLAGEAVRRLRERRIRVGVVTNQPAIGDGEISEREMADLHRRIERHVGHMDGWFVCPHSIDACCACRKPQPGLVLDAIRQFGVLPNECVVVGDIGSDVDAALNAGARGVLVPTPVTLDEEITRAPVVCSNLLDAVDYILDTADTA